MNNYTKKKMHLRDDRMGLQSVAMEGLINYSCPNGPCILKLEISNRGNSLYQLLDDISLTYPILGYYAYG